MSYYWCVLLQALIVWCLITDVSYCKQWLWCLITDVSYCKRWLCDVLVLMCSIASADCVMSYYWCVLLQTLTVWCLITDVSYCKHWLCGVLLLMCPIENADCVMSYYWCVLLQTLTVWCLITDVLQVTWLNHWWRNRTSRLIPPDYTQYVDKFTVWPTLASHVRSMTPTNTPLPCLSVSDSAALLAFIRSMNHPPLMPKCI